jgi:retron-type reverse transcriptase
MIGRQERQVNNMEREFFQTGKGLRQGDSLSPLLFNIVVDVLTKMLQKVARDYLIKDLGTELVADGAISLQY